MSSSLPTIYASSAAPKHHFSRNPRNTTSRHGEKPEHATVGPFKTWNDLFCEVFRRFTRWTVSHSCPESSALSATPRPLPSLPSFLHRLTGLLTLTPISIVKQTFE